MKVNFFEKVKLFWVVFRRKRLKRRYRRDELFITHLIKSVYQLLLTWMRTFTLKSTILLSIFTKSASRWYCSGLYISVHFYLTQILWSLLTIIWVERKLQNYSRKSYLNMCLFGLCMSNRHFLWKAAAMIDTYNTYNWDTPKNPDAKNL